MAKQKRVKRVKQRKKFKETGLSKLMKEVGTNIKKSTGNDTAFNAEYGGKEIKVIAKKVKQPATKKNNLLPIIGIGLAAFLLLKN
jgi:hypothetical protein